jgi:hypothetical protein
MDYLDNKYSSNIPEMKKNYPGLADDAYKGLQHFLGLGDAYIYLQAYKDAITSGMDWVKAHTSAQDEVNASIQQRTGKTPPKNMSVLNYLNDLLK